jgi:hypothetical protein
MLNDYLSGEEAKERIKQSIQDAETDSLLKRLGYGDYGITRWIIALIILIIAVELLL